MKKLSIVLFLFAFLIGPSTFSYARDGGAKKPAPSSTKATGEEEEEEEKSRYIYEKPTMDKLSQLYWALSMLDITNDQHLNNFLRINECDIYKDYVHHEFEWKDVRRAAKAYIKENKKSFPLRFQFVQPIHLGKYDLERERFEVLDDYKIDGIRRFVIYSLDYNANICGSKRVIEGYPRGLILELSRPFLFKNLPLEPQKAKEYITKKLDVFKELEEAMQTQQRLYETRDAYLILKVKLFAAQGEDRTAEGRILPNLLGVLEGYEVYADKYQEDLLYKKSYRKKHRKKLPLAVPNAPVKEGEGFLPNPKEQKAEQEAAEAKQN